MFFASHEERNLQMALKRSVLTQTCRWRQRLTSPTTLILLWNKSPI